MAEKPVIKRGEIVTCENGHVICECVKDLHLYDMAWGQNFGNFRQPIPETKWQYCNICGAKWMDQECFPWRVHVKNKWRT